MAASSDAAGGATAGAQLRQQQPEAAHSDERPRTVLFDPDHFRRFQEDALADHSRRIEATPDRSAVRHLCDCDNYSAAFFVQKRSALTLHG